MQTTRQDLYERSPNDWQKDRCRLCGKEIYRFGMGEYAMRSHARKHVREGTVREVTIQSPRSYNSYDHLFYLVKPQEDAPEPPLQPEPWTDPVSGLDYIIYPDGSSRRYER